MDAIDDGLAFGRSSACDEPGQRCDVRYAISPISDVVSLPTGGSRSVDSDTQASELTGAAADARDGATRLEAKPTPFVKQPSPTGEENSPTPAAALAPGTEPMTAGDTASTAPAGSAAVFAQSGVNGGTDVSPVAATAKPQKTQSVQHPTEEPALPTGDIADLGTGADGSALPTAPDGAQDGAQLDEAYREQHEALRESQKVLIAKASADPSAKEQLYREYFHDHPVWVDDDGTIFRAGVNGTDVALARRDAINIQGGDGQPDVTGTRSVRILISADGMTSRVVDVRATMPGNPPGTYHVTDREELARDGSLVGGKSSVRTSSSQDGRRQTHATDVEFDANGQPRSRHDRDSLDADGAYSVVDVKRTYQGGKVVSIAQHESVRGNDEDIDHQVERKYNDQAELTYERVSDTVSGEIEPTTVNDPEPGSKRTGRISRTATSVLGSPDATTSVASLTPTTTFAERYDISTETPPRYSDARDGTPFTATSDPSVWATETDRSVWERSGTRRPDGTIDWDYARLNTSTTWTGTLRQNGKITTNQHTDASPTIENIELNPDGSVKAPHKGWRTYLAWAGLAAAAAALAIPSGGTGTVALLGAGATFLSSGIAVTSGAVAVVDFFRDKAGLMDLGFGLAGAAAGVAGGYNAFRAARAARAGMAARDKTAFDRVISVVDGASTAKSAIALASPDAMPTFRAGSRAKIPSVRGGSFDAVLEEFRRALGTVKDPAVRREMYQAVLAHATDPLTPDQNSMLFEVYLDTLPPDERKQVDAYLNRMQGADVDWSTRTERQWKATLRVADADFKDLSDDEARARLITEMLSTAKGLSQQRRNQLFDAYLTNISGAARNEVFRYFNDSRYVDPVKQLKSNLASANTSAEKQEYYESMVANTPGIDDETRKQLYAAYVGSLSAYEQRNIENFIRSQQGLPPVDEMPESTFVQVRNSMVESMMMVQRAADMKSILDATLAHTSGLARWQQQALLESYMDALPASERQQLKQYLSTL